MGRAGDPGSAHACDMLCSRVLYCTSTLYTTVLNSLYTVRSTGTICQQRHSGTGGVRLHSTVRAIQYIKSRFFGDTEEIVRLTQAWRSIRDGSKMYSQKATLGRKVGKVLPKLSLGGRLLRVKN